MPKGLRPDTPVYYGDACKRGHVALNGKTLRRVSGRVCAECAAIRASSHRNADLAASRAKEKAYKDSRIEQTRKLARENMARQRERNPEKFRERDRTRYSGKSRTKQSTRAALQRRRELNKKKQVCACCGNTAFSEMYAFAAAVGGQVDHIVPVVMGGRHCLKNLQVLSVEDHARKTAKDFAEIAFARKRARLLASWPAAF